MNPDAAPPGPTTPASSAAPDPACLAALLLAHADRHGHAVSLKRVDSGAYQMVNPPMARLLRLEPDRIIGQTDTALFGAARAAALKAADDLAIASAPQPSHTEHRLEWHDERIACAVTRVALGIVDGGPPVWLATIWTDLRRGEEREAALQRALAQLEAEQRAQMLLRQEAATLQRERDRATTAARGAGFDEQLRREADLSAREQREFSLVMLELDPPTAPAGVDPAEARARALDALDRLMVANIRAMDATSRLGEARFAVLLSGVGLATAHSRIEGLRRQCATQVLAIGGREVGFTISVGIASFPHTAGSREELVRCAEGALHDARERGGNQVKLASIRFEPE